MPRALALPSYAIRLWCAAAGPASNARAAAARTADMARRRGTGFQHPPGGGVAARSVDELEPVAGRGGDVAGRHLVDVVEHDLAGLEGALERSARRAGSRT